MEIRIENNGWRDIEITRRTIDDQTEIRRIRNNLPRNLIRTVTNAHLASVLGKEFHSPILSTL